MFNLQRTIDNYNPETDPYPAPIYKGGKFLGWTKPGSHYRNILKYQRDLRSAVLEYDQKCRHDNNDGNPKTPAGVNPLMLYTPAPNVVHTPAPRKYPRTHMEEDMERDMERGGGCGVYVPGAARGLGPVDGAPDGMPIFRGFPEFGVP